MQYVYSSALFIYANDRVSGLGNLLVNLTFLSALT